MMALGSFQYQHNLLLQHIVEQGQNSGSLLLDTDASQLGCGFFFKFVCFRLEVSNYARTELWEPST